MVSSEGHKARRRETYPSASTWGEELTAPGHTKKQRKSVGFNQVEIREYSQCIGDNPSCHCGPPISLDWKYKRQTRRLSLDNYEAERQNSRCGDDFVISEENRIDRLLQLGYSIQDLLQADVNRTKDQLLRQKTLGKLKGIRIDETFERIRLKYAMRMNKSTIRQQVAVVA
mmetsp:Transcript_4834/g.10187  ORF Transcript_4834/g.10187 Transcript_4834/m.10187 type:complete len:171 (-) Transcript_4834:131-643(-)|eukprot:CAMPEP_0183296968 /NCGR_PEP_ID=MMETSP0160_2-20130417/4364_1 /TAXON_ID=2839 ORGANISM="Odontella Sinensis, Strain Grunow 1884" /NCGR_SAMPLE_ID=MMETSP0160_2 /ASSEMBLY_ACC=CAM_ASM_000250 /LENGTH=170 /DNA_ID=CAMNT_0025458679 /DNA_START=177 /DNA_END=689 /DNA_ORIENTATION=+